MGEQKIIMFDSPEAARFVENLSSWVSKDMYFGNGENSENAARYYGCTHVKCKNCKEPTPKGRIYCNTCEAENRKKRYNGFEEVDWDRESEVYSDSFDIFFSGWDEVEEYLEESENIKVEDLQLVACKRNYARIDVDIFSHLLPDDVDIIPDQLEKAIEVFNESMKDVVISWSPINKRIKLSDVETDKV